jgi:uncharacterized membrane protein
MDSLIGGSNIWAIWAVIVSGAALCLWLEQTHNWAAKVSAPVLAIVAAMALSNTNVMPLESAAYDVVDDYLVPLAIPLLLLRANVIRILRESGSMFIAFHVAAAGTIIGAFIAAFLFRDSVERVAEVAGIMTGSYIGGAVNFVAVQSHYNIPSELANPLIVADNFIMAGMFGLLFVIANNRFFRRHYPHPHALASSSAESRALAAKHWERKGIALLDIAKALAIAFAVVAAAKLLSSLLKAHVQSKALLAIIANVYLLITIFIVTVTTVFHRFTERINGGEELGMYFLSLFFFVLGLRADFMSVVLNVPVLFVFCLVMALANLAVALALGRLLRLNLEELLLGSNATLGGAPSVVAMAVAAGWSRLIVPGLLAAVWGYIIGTFVGIAVTETLKRLL